MYTCMCGVWRIRDMCAMHGDDGMVGQDGPQVVDAAWPVEVERFAGGMRRAAFREQLVAVDDASFG